MAGRCSGMEWIGWIGDDGQAGFRLRKEIGSCLGSLSCRQQTGSRGGKGRTHAEKKTREKKVGGRHSRQAWVAAGRGAGYRGVRTQGTYLGRAKRVCAFVVVVRCSGPEEPARLARIVRE